MTENWKLDYVEYFDEIIINGKEYSTVTDPLFDYLNSLARKLIDKQLYRYLSYRTYCPLWEIKDNKLYLTHLYHRDATPAINHRFKLFMQKLGNKSVHSLSIKDIFPGQTEVLADWYSGAMVVEGNFKHIFPDYDIDEKYLREMVIYIENGKVKDIRLKLKKYVTPYTKEVFEVFFLN